jgi:hypothetical protein
VVRAVLVAPSLLSVVNCLWAVLVVSLAKRDNIEVAGLPAAVAVMDAVVSVGGRRRATYNAREGLDPSHVF